MKNLISRLLIVAMMLLPFQTIHAGMIGTEQVSAVASAQASRDALLNTIARAEVAGQLHSMGVDANAVKARIGAMTDEEVRTLQGQIDTVPAGAMDFFWGWAAVIAAVVLVWYLYTHK